MSDKGWSEEEILYDNLSYIKMLDAVGMGDKIGFYAKIVGHGSSLEFVVERKVDSNWELNYFNTAEEAQKFIVESYPEVDWETTGWNH